MNKRELTNDKLLDVISFSRINKDKHSLTTSEIILVHQYMQLGIKLSDKVENKINEILIEIEFLEWHRPITRLRPDLRTEQLNTKTGLWQIVK